MFLEQGNLRLDRNVSLRFVPFFQGSMLFFHFVDLKFLQIVISSYPWPQNDFSFGA